MAEIVSEETSVRQIYSQYFRMIDSYFGSIKHYLGEHEEAHIVLGNRMGNYPLISDLILDATEELGDEIIKFWQTNARELIQYVRKQETLKCHCKGIRLFLQSSEVSYLPMRHGYCYLVWV